MPLVRGRFFSRFSKVFGFVFSKWPVHWHTAKNINNGRSARNAWSPEWFAVGGDSPRRVLRRPRARLCNAVPKTTNSRWEGLLSQSSECPAPSIYQFLGVQASILKRLGRQVRPSGSFCPQKDGMPAPLNNLELKISNSCVLERPGFDFGSPGARFSRVWE